MGLVRDTRNHETVPTRGYYHDASLRCGAGMRNGDSYCAVNITSRGYLGIVGEYLVLAGRVLGDAEFGRPPLLELTRYGGVEAGTGPGGSRGIRGIPQGRLAGKTKVIANLEVRSFFLPFSVGGQRFCLGTVLFADAGRVWAEALTASERDGSFRVHWGTGGGLRLRWGDSLLVRADVAYAPLGADLHAVPAIYIDVDQVL
jgi:outer membrane protein assembly factor BamA